MQTRKNKNKNKTWSIDNTGKEKQNTGIAKEAGITKGRDKHKKGHSWSSAEPSSGEAGTLSSVSARALKSSGKKKIYRVMLVNYLHRRDQLPRETMLSFFCMMRSPKIVICALCAPKITMVLLSVHPAHHDHLRQLLPARPASIMSESSAAAIGSADQ